MSTVNSICSSLCVQFRKKRGRAALSGAAGYTMGWTLIPFLKRAWESLIDCKEFPTMMGTTGESLLVPVLSLRTRAKSKKHLDNSSAKHLLAGHTISAAGVGSRLAFSEILHHVVANGRVAVNDAIDDFKFIG